jgi:hypothetical protein
MRRFGFAIKYRVAGSQESQTRLAVRIELNRHGGLVIYGPDFAGTECLDLQAVRQLSIETLTRPLIPDFALAVN